jgi:glycosyltransferase involved in cell wall biosynthesis
MTQTNEPRLSLCMIVKDEADQLPRCLKSVTGLVDEVIMVDTGSTDATCAVAGEWGAKIFHYPWDDDFAAARNFSLEQAGGDWILFLDADEELEPGCFGLIREVIKNQRIEGYYWRLICLSNPSDRAGGNTYPTFRLFRNRPYYRFSGRVHENILPSIEKVNPPEAIAYVPVNLYHYGYAHDIWQSKGKSDRNLKLLQLELADKGPNAYGFYYLGNEYYMRGEYQSALDHYRKAETLNNIGLPSQLASFIIRGILNSLTMLQQWPTTLDYVSQAIAKFPDYTDLYFRRGYAWFQLSDFHNSMVNFVICLKLGEVRIPYYTSMIGVGTFIPWHYLGMIFQNTGRPEMAQRAFMENIRSNPRQEAFWNDLQKLFYNTLDWEEHSADILRFVDSLRVDEVGHIEIVRAFSTSHHWAEIRQILRRINPEALLEQQINPYYYLSGCACFYEGDYEEASDWFDRIDPETKDEYARLVSLRRIERSWISEDYEAADMILTQINGCVSSDAESGIFKVYTSLHRLFKEGQYLPMELFSETPLFSVLLSVGNSLVQMPAENLLAKIIEETISKATSSQLFALLNVLIQQKRLDGPANRIFTWFHTNANRLTGSEILQFLKLKIDFAVLNDDSKEAMQLIRIVLRNTPHDYSLYLRLIGLLKTEVREVQKNIELRV